MVLTRLMLMWRVSGWEIWPQVPLVLVMKWKVCDSYLIPAPGILAMVTNGVGPITSG